jgi:hypothetical protein
VELQRTLDRIHAQGLGVAAISYDAPIVLKTFAERRGITFPLLSDTGSAVIRAFGILNQDIPAGTIYRGVPHPGTYIVDREGRVVAKYFEENFTERYTGADILIRRYGAAAGAAHTAVETRHLTASTAASADHVTAGQRIALTLDLEMKPRMHVYAPEVKGYKPVEWTITGGATPHPVEFPKSQVLRLDAIDETAPVYLGTVRLVRDVTIGKAKPGALTIEGALIYQACDDKQCYTPQTVPLKWELTVEPMDVQRVKR